MSTQPFKLEAVPPLPLNFTVVHQHHPYQARSNSSTQLVAQNASLQAAHSSVTISKPSIPRGLTLMPPEIQAMIWAEKMSKPGLHFLAVQVPRKGGPTNDNSEGVRKIKLTEPIHQIVDVHYPYTSYFPKGIRSAYHAWADLVDAFPGAQSAMELALVEKRTIATHSGANVTIDAATDLVYMKFHWRPGVGKGKRGPSQYVPSPAYWMLILDHEELNGIRHVAIEMPEEAAKLRCIYWPSVTDGICGRCGGEKGGHDDGVSSELWLVADFLHCLRDLETVVCVFTDVKQGPRSKGDKRYTISGRPDPRAIETESGRWDETSSEADVFRGDGGCVRELRGAHVVLPVAHVADALQAYYCFHSRTSIGGQEAVSTRPRDERMGVRFKLASVEVDGGHEQGGRAPSVDEEDEVTLAESIHVQPNYEAGSGIP